MKCCMNYYEIIETYCSVQVHYEYHMNYSILYLKFLIISSIFVSCLDYENDQKRNNVEQLFIIYRAVYHWSEAIPSGANFYLW